MPSITISLTDAQATAIAEVAADNAKLAELYGADPVAPMTLQQWAQMHIHAIAQSACAESCLNKARAAGITSVGSLTEADIEAIKAARAAKL